jgi:hypothetical protein
MVCRYIEEEFKTIIEPLYSNVEMAWKGYVTCDRAMIEPNAAWKDALELRSSELDQALSQSQVLYFASTTKGFVAPTRSEPKSSDNPQPSSSNNQEDGPEKSAFCAVHRACVKLGLTGDCCPTSGGVYLGCCDSENQPDKTATNSLPTPATTPAPGTSKSQQCVDNKACADLGLTGNCCPSDGGADLGCCDS